MSDSFYSKKPEWADITPVPQDDGPNPLVPIAYSSDYKDAMDYFRAVSKNDERSPRVLELIAAIIEMNPAHYTVWQYRQKVLFTLGSDLNKELEYIDSIAENQSKNYQIWHHRQVVVEKLGNGDKELEFINEILEGDSKNYHAWSYRQWVVAHFDKWDEELSFTDDMLVFDIRNNSAWNYRHFVLSNRPRKVTLEELEDEIEFSKKKIALAPNNPSSWAYLSSILEKAKKQLAEMKGFLESLREKEITSPHLWSMYIDMYEQNAVRDKKPIDPEAIEMCDRLANTFDAIRQNYWNYKKSKLMLL
ncbi:hypothetical protein J3Q64DRAFT_1772588 [Phycomyces blakesleeanus]|uniref:Protein farnesyltransferase/geranylgeranyltransferase type-1 subunit alpha n=2 Tax=Phycomyces blakesleeanus TaxID=4837 RepID=A0A167M384_PHYB8|nr:hypothetical protein PHYBLDRAFT_134630 [Phycomyces blakesleeanus NRRL 1555(-)]OAD71644.1 hypothetical protein PHYBLDRAFT_134630 [Phycomyces blakesleeanus NRRL 1555(-)]|eukprot:XP_018289684.1 hypothetical protein PHYBLDRAFT_134630 [Phycomyces blakesleeanus NRRL 1555(-)]